MGKTRSRFTLMVVPLMVVLLFLAGRSLADSYPSKPIHFVIGYPPGTLFDAIARLVGTEMTKRIGQPIVLEFKPGANVTIAAKYVANSAPDGYTLFYGAANTAHPVFNKNNAVDASKELAPVSLFASSPQFLFARASLPVTTLRELAAFAKANPNTLKFGTQSANNSLAMQTLKDRLEISTTSIQDIPYKQGAQILIALLAAEVDLSIGTGLPLLTHIREGKVRPLFVASTKRSGLLPNVPTALEAGAGDYTLAVNQGLWAPLKTPTDVIRKLSLEATAAVAVSSVSDQIQTAFASEVVGSNPEQLMQSFREEMQFWSEAARRANYRPK